MKTEHAQFAGTIPQNYDKYLGPLMFEPYATDIVQRIDINKAKKVLEIACGTGRVTRHLIQKLVPEATLVATDLNADMLAIANQYLQYPNLSFTTADAQQLPFEDASFDVVVCQFGLMFVPDKQKAFTEAYRILKPGGQLLFNTWDRLENNQLSLLVKNVIANHFDKAAADFYNVPFSFYNQQTINTLLSNAGFKHVNIEVVSKEGTHATPEGAVKGLILGTPAFKVIANKDPHAPEQLVDIAHKEVATLFGNELIKTELTALVCEAIK